MNDHLLHLLTHWLWIEPTGGCITMDSICHGFTEYKKDDIVYRSHPSYRSERAWHDWEYFKWNGFDKPIIGQIKLFIDLSQCQYLSEDEIYEKRGDGPLPSIENHDNLTPSQICAMERSNMLKNYISQHKLWAVIHSAHQQAIPHSDYSSRYQFKSKIASRVDLEEDKYRIVPIESIESPAFVIMDDIKRSTIKNESTSAIVIDHPSTWSEHFITRDM